MLKQIRGIPSACVCCESTRLKGRQGVVDGITNIITCQHCQAIMVVQPEADEDETEVIAELERCPHCGACDSLQEAQGFEWCGTCGLDPNEEHVSSTYLAHLWREGSGIRGHLEKNHHKPENASGQFIRTRCGPHCVYSEVCEQGTQDFVFCFRRHRDGLQPGPRSMLEGLEGITKAPSRTSTSVVQTGIESAAAAVACAAGGWLEKHVIGIAHDSSDSEEHTDTGS